MKYFIFYFLLMKPEISYNFNYIRSRNIYSTKGLENASFCGKFLKKKGS